MPKIAPINGENPPRDPTISDTCDDLRYMLSSTAKTKSFITVNHESRRARRFFLSKRQRHKKVRYNGSPAHRGQQQPIRANKHMVLAVGNRFKTIGYLYMNLEELN
jgi:hypothetical protein